MLTKELFNPDDRDLKHVGSAKWCQRVFELAYCGDKGPFEDAIHKLESGFSVLVYLPGSCVSAAADYVINHLSGDWTEFGKREKSKDIVDLWGRTTSFSERVIAWLAGESQANPQAIYHNLDMLADGRGGLYGHTFAQNALFSIAELTRSGTVLGLSDRLAGELPSRIESCFPDIINLRQIGIDGFRRIIPRTMVNIAGFVERGGTNISESAVKQIWARLRWNDPLQAVRTMQAVARAQHNMEGVLQDIAERTRPVGYLAPAEAFPQDVGQLTGYDREVTLDDLEQQIICPYLRWAKASSDGASVDSDALLKKLQPGVILYGPPGTGKTTLARWIAKQIGWPIKVVSAAEIRRPGFGDAERIVRKMFQDARRAAPCVLVLDDADDLLMQRSQLTGSTASADVGIVNAVIQELQGFNGTLEGVLTIVTTNRFGDMDQAIRERISLHVPVPFPLDENQIGEIVDSTSTEYGYVLDGLLREKLVKFFYQHVYEAGMKAPNLTREDRLRCLENLFSPRLIARAMLYLNANTTVDHPQTAYRPTETDFERIRRYFSRQLVAG